MSLLRGGGSGNTVRTKLTPTDSSGLARMRTYPVSPVRRTPVAPSGPNYGGGGYGGGGGGGGYVPPAPTAPAPPVTPLPEVVPEVLDEETLLKMLAGIEAQYGVSREQLLAGEGEASQLYEFISANLAAAETQAQAGAVEQGIGRGVLRSGLAQEEQARIEQMFAQQRLEAEAAKTTRLNQIALAIQALEAQLQNDFTNTAVDYASTNLGTDEALAQALALADAQYEEAKRKAEAEAKKKNKK